MSTFVISLDEAMWGCLLVAITMAIHGTGMFGILQIIDLLKERFAPPWSPSWVVLASSFSRAC